MLFNPYELPGLKTPDQREIFSAPSMIVTVVAGAPLPAQISPLLLKYCRCCPNIAAAVPQSFTKVAPNDYFRSRVQTNIGLVPKNVQLSNCFRFDFMDFCRESCFVTITILYTTHHKITRSNNTCRISGCLGKLHDKLYLGPLYVKRTMKLLVKVVTII